MIDYLALTLVHGLLIIGLFRIVQNDALDPAKSLPQRRKTKTTQSDDHEGKAP